MITAVKEHILQVYWLLGMIISIVELMMGGGNGEEKKKKAIEYWKLLVDKLAIHFSSIPPFIWTLLKIDAFLNWLIDMIVAIFNKNNFFVHSGIK